MAIVLSGLGKELSGKYKVLEVSHSYSPDDAYKTELKAQKRLYGNSAKDNKRIAEAAEAVENGNTSKSTPGGSDKPAELEGPIDYSDTTSSWVDIGPPTIIDGIKQ
jgi:hypothetical protein